MWVRFKNDLGRPAQEQPACGLEGKKLQPGNQLL
jgi:hypothetical protein